MELHHRGAAVTTVMAKFKGQPFQWGRYDCVRLATAAVRQLGHRVSLVKAGSYDSELGAVRALKRAGFDSLEAALDTRFPVRIAPAAALPGDIIGLQSPGDWPALTVAIGNGRVLGFIGGACAVMQPNAYICAWRVPLLRKAV